MYGLMSLPYSQKVGLTIKLNFWGYAALKWGLLLFVSAIYFALDVFFVGKCRPHVLEKCVQTRVCAELI